ncbi:hypothetical protein ACLKA7_000958 [Drosophila subpalustris]
MNRVSQRSNKGKPPKRLGFEPEMSNSEDEMDNTMVENNMAEELQAKLQDLEERYIESQKENRQLQSTLRLLTSQVKQQSQAEVSITDEQSRVAENYLGTGKLMPTNASSYSHLPSQPQQSTFLQTDPQATYSLMPQSSHYAYQYTQSVVAPPLMSSYVMPPSNILMPPSNFAMPPSNSAAPPNVDMPPSTSYSTGLPYQSNSTRMNQPYIRKLQDLPPFSGAPEQWPMFQVAFRETTNAHGYTNLENMSRLQKALFGAAKNLVESLIIYPDNVEAVMNTLCHHYGRPEILIRSQLDKVRTFPPVKYNKITDIVEFSVMTANLTAFLENCNAQPHLQNPTLMEDQ